MAELIGYGFSCVSLDVLLCPVVRTSGKDQGVWELGVVSNGRCTLITLITCLHT